MLTFADLLVAALALDGYFVEKRCDGGENAVVPMEQFVSIRDLLGLKLWVPQTVAGDSVPLGWALHGARHRRLTNPESPRQRQTYHRFVGPKGYSACGQWRASTPPYFDMLPTDNTYYVCGVCRAYNPNRRPRSAGTVRERGALGGTRTRGVG